MRPDRDRVWYVAYGSNLSAHRFRCYLAGGRPVGSLRSYPGCRDTSEPARIVPLVIPGGLAFTGPSSTWGGGTAVYDPDGGARVAVTAYLVRVGQLADVLAQEMRRHPGTDLDLGPLRTHGRHRSGPGRYETILQVGTRDAIPMVTLTSERGQAALLTAPTEPYLRTMATGLRDAHGWSRGRIVSYLASIPGSDLTGAVQASAPPRDAVS
ncbi:MAG: hypothetical protein JWP95_799 [Actinotalea sp.]|nr:hypothetical protein [Actinotalea sp.]